MSYMTSSIVRISPEMATHMIQNEMFPGQRPINKSHVEFLADTMRKGEFNGGSAIQIAKALDTGWLVIDGQQRLHAIVKHGSPVAANVVRHECGSRQEIALIYSRIDRGRGRSMVDAMRALGLLNETHDLSPTELKHFSQASVLLRQNMTSASISGSSYDARSAEARHEEMVKWHAPAVQYFVATRSASEPKLFDRREVVSIGIVTFADAPEIALRFWGEAAKDDGLRATDPRKKMLEAMRKAPATRGSIGYLGHVVAACWNAYVEGRDLSKVIVRDPRANVALASTRYSKR